MDGVELGSINNWTLSHLTSTFVSSPHGKQEKINGGKSITSGRCGLVKWKLISDLLNVTKWPLTYWYDTWHSQHICPHVLGLAYPHRICTKCTYKQCVVHFWNKSVNGCQVICLQVETSILVMKAIRTCQINWRHSMCLESNLSLFSIVLTG